MRMKYNTLKKVHEVENVRVRASEGLGGDVDGACFVAESISRRDPLELVRGQG